MGTLWIFADHLALIACFITYEKWVQRKKYPFKACLPCGVSSHTCLVRILVVVVVSDGGLVYEFAIYY